MPKDHAPDDQSNILELANTPAHMQIGPDAVTLLAGYGLKIFGNRYALWDSLVQVASDGSIARRVNPAHIFSTDHSFSTYGAFLREYLLPRAEEISSRLKDLSDVQRLHTLNGLVERSTDCPRTFWLLSSNYVRPYLFPGAYAPGTRRRIDRVRYKIHAHRSHQNGKFISPRSLDKAEVEKWQAEVAASLPNYDVERFAPVIA